MRIYQNFKNGIRKRALENAIVIKDDKILNESGLRNDKEFVNHKILDCIGDLYLVGYRLIGSLKCKNGGHSLTNKLLRKIFMITKTILYLRLKEKFTTLNCK